MYPHNQSAELPAAEHSHVHTPAQEDGQAQSRLPWSAGRPALLWPSPHLPRVTSCPQQSQGHSQQGHINMHIHMHWKTLLQGYSTGPHSAPGAFWWRNQSLGVWRTPLESLQGSGAMWVHLVQPVAKCGCEDAGPWAGWFSSRHVFKRHSWAQWDPLGMVWLLSSSNSQRPQSRNNFLKHWHEIFTQL